MRHRLPYLLLLGLTFGVQGRAEPSLRCELSYGGHAQTVTARPVSDPYAVPSVDIAGRFLFKPVLVGEGERLRRVLVYVYRQAPERAVLIQQAKFLPPFPRADANGQWPLTGRQYLYAGELERELMYQCVLEGLRP
ncbi:MAG: hypothetical protein ACKOXQ_00400 [Hydrogenophaga sp.]